MRASIRGYFLFPAQAGVIPWKPRNENGIFTFPRASGGDPDRDAG